MVVNRYTRVAVVLHWAIAVLIVVNVAMALSFDALPDEWVRPFVGAHVVHGLLYALMLLLPLSGWMHDSAWKDAATHPMTLFGIVPWPRIGAIMSVEPVTKETLHTVFGNIHVAFGYVLYALLALHIGGALKHQWLDREPELQRMSL